MRPGEQITTENLEALIEGHMAFIIRTISNLTGRYVAVENDEEFSIALSAFAEAVEKYDETRGSFLSFARLVIESRLKSYFARENARPREASLEELYEQGQDFPDESGGFGGSGFGAGGAGFGGDFGGSGYGGGRGDLHDEVAMYREELSLFGLTLEILADEAPKHRDTRENAMGIAKKASGDEPTVKATYQKRRLPVRAVARVAQVTEKVVKRSKSFILAAMIIFVKDFPGLNRFLEGARC